jgi:hypothetical protein
MSTDEADLEYGPTPETADHEHTDIEPSIAWKFAIWLGVATVISAGIVYGTFWYLERQEATASRAAQVFPLAAGQQRTPPGPNLQTQPFKDIYLLRQGEQEKLTTYAWIDKSTGTVRMPIADAMRVLEQRGLPTRAEQPADLNQVVMDSSAGRTKAGR